MHAAGSSSGSGSRATVRRCSSPTTRSARPSTGRRRRSAGRVELDRVLRAMDERHWLVWTSRPTPLQGRAAANPPRARRRALPAAGRGAGRRRRRSTVEEKALILFRHARAAELPDAARRCRPRARLEHRRATSTSRRSGSAASSAAGSLQLDRVARACDAAGSQALIAAEIREPTAAMAASFRALAPEHRALLIALLDVPAGPGVRARARRGRAPPFGAERSRSDPRALLDRLSDHFVRTLADRRGRRGCIRAGAIS